jgi:glyoxylase-like metal-dependent hydrolase (beta-lactamase superfamily II)
MLFVDSITGAVFTGDHILPRMAPTTGIQFDGERRRPSLPAYLASLKLTRDLRPTGITGPVRAYPGHGEPIAELRDEVDWTVRFLEQRARRALAALRGGPATAYDLALRMFPHLGPRHVRPVMAETLGLLDLLAERGQAVADETAPLVVWSALTEG